MSMEESSQKKEKLEFRGVYKIKQATILCR